MLNDGYVLCIMIKRFILSSFSFSGHLCAVNLKPVTVLHHSEGNISFQPKIIFAVAQGTQLEIIILSLIKTGFFASLLSHPQRPCRFWCQRGRMNRKWSEVGAVRLAQPLPGFSHQPENKSESWKAETAVGDWPCLGQQPHKQWPSSCQSEREMVVFNGEIFRQLWFWWHRKGGERARL